jgi:hypothetical protein
MALVGLAIPAAAQPVGSEFQINTYTTDGQMFPSVASDADGDFVVVWQSAGQDGFGNGVFGQRYDSAGDALGAEFRVNSYTSGFEDRASVASDADGNFVVVWNTFDQDGQAGGIFGQRYDSDGTPLGSEFRVNTTTTGSQDGGALAFDGSGNFVVVWSGQGPGDRQGIFGQRYDSDGLPRGAEFRVNSFTPELQALPSVASDNDGNFVVVWSGRDATDFNGVFGRRFDRQGVPLGAQFHVNSDRGFIQQLPSVASDASGDFVVVWEGYGQDGSGNGIFARRYDSAGLPQGPQFRVNSFTSGSQSTPSVASDAAGNFVVAWNGRGQTDASGVFAQRYDSDGAPLGGEFRVNAFTSSSQGGASVASDTAGHLVFAWQSDGQDGSEEGILGRRRRH